MQKIILIFGIQSKPHDKILSWLVLILRGRSVSIVKFYLGHLRILVRLLMKMFTAWKLDLREVSIMQTFLWLQASIL